MKLELTRVEAPTLDEALRKVRSMLGREAMIVSTRTFRRGGVFGLGGREVVEVFATDTRSRIANVRREESSRLRHMETNSEKEMVPQPPAAPPPPSRHPHSHADDGSGHGAPTYEEFTSALTLIRKEIRECLSRSGSAAQTFDHPFLTECFEFLVARELDPQIASRIVEHIATLRMPREFPEPAQVRAVIRTQLIQLFPVAPPRDHEKKPRLIALVGPTGVGKTTTIAKLAAKAKLNEGQRIGLVTLDTFRIAAVDQLEKYAEIIGLPLDVATTPDELAQTVQKYHRDEMDLVFVDSAGRSHRDELKMAQLRKFLNVLPECEVHLVLSTTTHSATLENIAARFSGIGFDRVILTKVDESVSFGALVRTLLEIGRPVSFVTDGQNVPDDIIVADPERLADLVLKTNAL